MQLKSGITNKLLVSLETEEAKNVKTLPTRKPSLLPYVNLQKQRMHNGQIICTDRV